MINYFAKNKATDKVAFYIRKVDKINCKDNRIINKAAYSVMGINMDGLKDISGLVRTKVPAFGLGSAINFK
jgi:hypothetical protein